MHSHKRTILTITKEDKQALEQLKQTRFSDATYTEMYCELIRMGLEAAENGAALTEYGYCYAENHNDTPKRFRGARH